METLSRLTLPERLAALAGVAAAAASIAGFIPGVYRDLPAVIAQSHGYDVGNLVVVLVLLTSLAVATGGSARARLVAVGALGCLLYSFVTYAFLIVVNAATPLYIAVLSLGGWAFVTGFAQAGGPDADQALSGRLPRRTTAAVFAVLAIFFALNWLRQLAAAAITGVPTELSSINWPTNPVWVLDLGFALPLMAVAAHRLAVRSPAADRLALPLLVFVALLGVTILSMTVWMAADGQTIDPVLPGLFIVVVLVSGALAVRALGPWRTPAAPRSVSAGGVPSR